MFREMFEILISIEFSAGLRALEGGAEERLETRGQPESTSGLYRKEAASQLKIGERSARHPQVQGVLEWKNLTYWSGRGPWAPGRCPGAVLQPVNVAIAYS